MDASSTSDVTVEVAAVVPTTDAEGPGRRFAIWVQGCTIRCDGCFNPHMWSSVGGVTTSVDDLLGQLEDVDVEGITLLGGEPFEQANGLSRLAASVQDRGLSVMAFTGYEYESLTGPQAPTGAADLIAATDLLVSGPYDAAKPDFGRPWVGSTNQEFHFLSGRYHHLRDDLASMTDRIELRIRPDGTVSVNGWAGVAQLDELLADLAAPIGRGRVR